MLLRLACLVVIACNAPAAEIQVERLPEGGMQPQVAVDPQGGVHIVYLSGDPKASTVSYIQRPAAAAAFSAPLVVNSTPGSAMAMGTVRGARLALGRKGRIHVLWNGTGGSMWYASALASGGGSFSQQRNLMQVTSGCDGGGAIAADDTGRVIAAWHTHVPGAREGEGGRGVFISLSRDDGATFSGEEQAWEEPTGVCGCCSLALDIARNGRLVLLYRSAGDNGTQRDMYLLSALNGNGIEGVDLAPWKIQSCPMSTSAIVHTRDRLMAAWETNSQIWTTAIDQRTGKAAAAHAIPNGSGNRHHPSIAISSRGDYLVTWAEDTGWAKGGSVVWQHFTADGSPDGAPGRAGDLPAWDMPAAFVVQDAFHVIY